MSYIYFVSKDLKKKYLESLGKSRLSFWTNLCRMFEYASTHRELVLKTKKEMRHLAHFVQINSGWLSECCMYSRGVKKLVFIMWVIWGRFETPVAWARQMICLPVCIEVRFPFCDTQVKYIYRIFYEHSWKGTWAQQLTWPRKSRMWGQKKRVKWRFQWRTYTPSREIGPHTKL